jgi:hypothetical protein
MLEASECCRIIPIRNIDDLEHDYRMVQRPWSLTYSFSSFFIHFTRHLRCGQLVVISSSGHWWWYHSAYPLHELMTLTSLLRGEWVGVDFRRTSPIDKFMQAPSFSDSRITRQGVAHTALAQLVQNVSSDGMSFNGKWAYVTCYQCSHIITFRFAEIPNQCYGVLYSNGRAYIRNNDLERRNHRYITS